MAGALDLWPDVLIAALGLRNFARGTRLETERLGDVVVPSVDVGSELDAGAVPERRLIEQANRDRGLQLDEALVVLLHRLAELLGNALLLRQRGRELDRILDANAPVAAVAIWQAEQRLGGGVVEVDRLVVSHVELDQAERVLWPRLLDPLVAVQDEAIRLEPGLALGRQLLLSDPLRHGPGGVGHEPDDRCLDLRRWLVRLAFDHLPVIRMLTVAPVVEEGSRGVDVDPRPRWRPREPAQPLHANRELARPIRWVGVQRVERVAANHPIRLEPELGLDPLHRRDQVGRIMCRWPRRSGVRSAGAAASLWLRLRLRDDLVG